MKKRNWLIAALLLICVMVMSTVLVACKPNESDPKPDPKPSELTKSDFINQMMETASTLYSVDNAKYMSLDFKVGTSLKDNRGTTDKNEFNYELVVKANINLNEDIYNDENAVEKIDKKSNFLIQINEKEGTTVNELFSLLYASEFGEDGAFVGNYFYLAFANAEKPFKIDAFSFSKILYAIAPAPAAAAEGGFDIASLIPTVLTLIVSDEGFAIENDTYSFKIDLNQVWAMVGPMLSGLLENPEDLQIEGIDLPAILDQVGGAIQEIWPGLSIEVDGEENLVDTVAELIKYIDTVFPKIVINASFTFGKNDFKANFAVDYAADKDATKSDYVFTLDIAKASISSYNSQLDVFADYKWEKAELAEIDSFGLLNFAVDGTIEYTGSLSNTAITGISYSIDMDINPFVLFDGLTLDNIKRLGYINITANGMGSDTSNLLTIHSDFADGAAYLNLNAVNRNTGSLKSVGIGGKLDFAALADAIIVLGGGSVEVTAPAADNALGIDPMIMDLLKVVVNALNLKDITNNGVVLDTSTLMKDIIAILNANGIDITGGTDFALPAIVNPILFNNASSMAIKVNENGVVYGGCERIAVADIDFSAFRDGDTVGLINGKIPKASYKDGVEVNTNAEPYLEYGQPFADVLKMDSTGGNAATTFTMSGKDAVTGKDVTDAKMVYLGTQGYDPYKAGWQYIRVYYGANNMWNDLNGKYLIVDVAQTVKDLLVGMPMLPINGIQSYDTWVCVRDEVDNDSAFLEINGTNSLVAGENIAEVLDATLIYDNGRSVKVTSDMISSPKAIISDGKITKAGTFILDINYYEIHTTVKVKVGAVSMNTFTELALDGQTDLFDALNPMYKHEDTAGIWVEERINMTIESVKPGYSTAYTEKEDIDALFVDPENGNYAFKMNYDWNNKKVVVVFNYEMNGKQQTVTAEFKLVYGGTEALSYKNYNFNFYQKADMFTIKEDGVTYVVSRQEDGTYKALDADGNEWTGQYTVTGPETGNDGNPIFTGNRFTNSTDPYFLDLENPENSKPAETYLFKIELSNGLYFEKEMTVKEPVAGKTTAVSLSKYTRLDSFVTLGVDAAFVDPTLNGAISLKWDKDAQEWKLVYDNNLSNVLDSNKASFNLDLFNSAGEEVTYTASGTSGYIGTDAGIKVASYSITITLKGTDYTFTGEVNDKR